MHVAEAYSGGGRGYGGSAPPGSVTLSPDGRDKIPYRQKTFYEPPSTWQILEYAPGTLSSCICHVNLK